MDRKRIDDIYEWYTGTSKVNTALRNHTQKGEQNQMIQEPIT